MKKILFLCLLLISTEATAQANSTATNPANHNVFNLSQAIDYADQGFAKKAIFKGDNYMILLFAFKKGQILEGHTIPMDAFIQILEGSAIVTIDGEDAKVSAGEKITLPKNLSHALTAEENFKMLLVK